MKVVFTSESLKNEFEKYAEGEFVLCNQDTVCDFFSSSDIYIVDLKTAAILKKCESEKVPSIFVAVNEGEKLTDDFYQGEFDDLIVLPLREADVKRVLRMHEYLHSLRELESNTKGIPLLVKKLQEDLHLAQKIQKRLIRDKFPSMSGIKIKSKYFCGLKSGGDYFDVFEFPDGNNVGFILADSSSYSLSNKFLAALMQFSMHGENRERPDPAAIIKTLYAKIRDDMKEKESLSVFFGVLDRKTYTMRYAECGEVFGLQKNSNQDPLWFASGKESKITKEALPNVATKEVSLEPGERLVLLSDGWHSQVQSSAAKFVNPLISRNLDAQDLVNEFSFRLRQSIEKDPDDTNPMPEQDCSILIVDIAKNVLRLAR